MEGLTKANQQHAQQESQSSALVSERLELLNKECERYSNRALAAEKAAADATAALVPYTERIRLLEADKAALEGETVRKEGA